MCLFILQTQKYLFLSIFAVSIKVQLFWEGHKNLRTLPHGFDICLVNIKTMRKIVQIFVAFSEKLNFNATQAIA